MASTLETLSSLDLDHATGGTFDLNRMVASGNRGAAAGAAAGSSVGGMIGIPGGPAGMATGAGMALGWAGGAGYDAYQQIRGN